MDQVKEIAKEKKEDLAPETSKVEEVTVKIDASDVTDAVAADSPAADYNNNCCLPAVDRM